MADWKLVPSESRLPPLVNPRLDLIYQSLEETSRFARLAWFYVGLTLAVAFGTIGALRDDETADSFVGIVGHKVAPLVYGLLAFIALTVLISTCVVGLVHMSASVLRGELRRADFVAAESELQEKSLARMAKRAAALERRLSAIRTVLVISVFVILICVATVPAKLAWNALTDAYDDMSYVPSSPPPPHPASH